MKTEMGTSQTKATLVNFLLCCFSFFCFCFVFILFFSYFDKEGSTLWSWFDLKDIYQLLGIFSRVVSNLWENKQKPNFVFLNLSFLSNKGSRSLLVFPYFSRTLFLFFSLWKEILLGFPFKIFSLPFIFFSFYLSN